MPSSPIVPFAATHAVRPLAVASIGRAQATLALRIGQGCQAALPALAPDAVLTVQAADEPAPAWPDPLSVQGSFGRIELARGARLLRALTGIDLGEHQHGPHWEWLEGAVCARLAATPLAGADRLAPATTAHAATPLLTLRLTLRGAGHLVATHARASAADWLRLLAGPRWLRLQTPFDAHAGLTLHLPLQLARHRLPYAMLASLGPGDVLLPERSAFDCGGQGHVSLGSLRASVRYQAPGTLIILALENRMDPSHEPAGHTDQEAQREAALDQLPATLDIELGQLTITLGALRSLAVGSTLLLPGADPAALDIRCAGQLLGRAEAVDIDGRLGVRITEWSAA
ncbi:type III secretion system cytoplasmic ring protein SctQ [Massilia antarctica]|uniref:Type III secretion system cytoplasmic ring protein SctQ n=1 Tax=Massilia antarctica TaxID=2765360 RepID=A0AA49A6H5_9BURK|nr:type III secretion system cytoplasmic ring protein SctQ [Massilia antarctica]QPI47657.1 type III secretion system cytoplasmic ring protein SctQ [Massilia antarctica]